MLTGGDGGGVGITGKLGVCLQPTNVCASIGFCAGGAGVKGECSDCYKELKVLATQLLTATCVCMA